MNEFTFDILLEFLYKKFAITFALCVFGSLIRKWFPTKSTDPNHKKILVGEVLISAVFSTFLMCAVADYVNIDLHFEVYAIISIVLGMYGIRIIRLIMDGKFMISFIKNFAKSFANPTLKNVVNSASDALSEGNKLEEDQQESNDEKK